MACRALVAFLSLGIAGCGSEQRTRSPIPSAERPEIRLNEDGEASRIAFEVINLGQEDLNKLAEASLSPAQWTALFSVFVGSESETAPSERPPILGSFQIDGKVLRFVPKYPVERGLRYRAVFNPSKLPGHAASEKAIESVLSLRKGRPLMDTAVEHVYPTANRLPENQLKFYVHFSAPMSRGESYKHVHLLDGGGKEVNHPFLELDEELWDPEGRRFTLFCDPGRVKRGLKPREELGPVLEEEKSYTLVIDNQWLDANGKPLKDSHRKFFSVGQPDDQPPDPKTWKIEPPADGTRKPLCVVFPKPMEHALLERTIQVADAKGNKLAGTITVANEEKLWCFAPAQSWQAGKYTLVVDKILEDLAGNSIGRPFEVDVLHPMRQKVQSEFVKLPFEIVAGRTSN